ncbi:MAG TPA: GNAT family N-acetyltransferase [Terriglobales bacterium]|nr:GNAT family N-acetyltransferase [Terriglobales bacterium]
MAAHRQAVASPSLEIHRNVTVRRAKPEDAEICGRICYEAFKTISEKHGFPPDFPSPDIPVAVLSMMFSTPTFYAVVAEVDGRIVGSNCLDERGVIAGVGPITVDPKVQDRSIGRRLMIAVLERATEKQAPGVRLVQTAFHNRSLSLYAKLGFDAREPLSVMQGAALNTRFDGYRVRHAEDADVEECNHLCYRVHGHHRGGELVAAIKRGTAKIVEYSGRISGYANGLGFFDHAVGESNREIQALIADAPQFVGPGILVPTRNAELFRWCLNQGLRVVQPMTLMSLGLYNEPAGAWLPSVLY